MKHFPTKITALSLLVLATAFCTTNAFADIDNSGNTSTTFSVQINTSISLSLDMSSKSVSLTPGAMYPASDSDPKATSEVTVSTNDLAGYTLTVKDADGDNALRTATDSIPAGSGLAAGTSAWGIRGVSFGAHTSSTIDTTNWSAVPISTATVPLNIVDSGTLSAAIKNEVTTIEYGVSTAGNQAAGTYSDTIVYTLATKAS